MDARHLENVKRILTNEQTTTVMELGNDPVIVRLYSDFRWNYATIIDKWSIVYGNILPTVEDWAIGVTFRAHENRPLTSFNKWILVKYTKEWVDIDMLIYDTKMFNEIMIKIFYRWDLVWHKLGLIFEDKVLQLQSKIHDLFGNAFSINKFVSSRDTWIDSWSKLTPLT